MWRLYVNGLAGHTGPLTSQGQQAFERLSAGEKHGEMGIRE